MHPSSRLRLRQTNSVVRRILANGLIVAYAGTGSAGTTGGSGRLRAAVARRYCLRMQRTARRCAALQGMGGLPPRRSSTALSTSPLTAWAGYSSQVGGKGRFWGPFKRPPPPLPAALQITQTTQFGSLTHPASSASLPAPSAPMGSEASAGGWVNATPRLAHGGYSRHAYPVQATASPRRPPLPASPCPWASSTRAAAALS